MALVRESQVPNRKAEKRQKRAPYEFDKETICEGLKECGYTCERCGVKKKDTLDGYLEAHHRLPIHIVTHYFPHIAPAFIKSLSNLEILCIPCHRLEHQNEDDLKYREYAEYFEQEQLKTEQRMKLLGGDQRRRV